MKLIAHRGNFAGQNTERENTVAYLEEALEAGYDVEFDIRVYNGYLCLGHDKPAEGVLLQRIPNIEWLRDSRKWVHCKDEESYDIVSMYPDIQCFMHDEEPSVEVDNTDKIWTHSKVPVNAIQKEIAPNTYIVHESAEDFHMTAGIYGYNVSRFKNLQDKPWDITTIILDVDGVMTNGRKTIIQGNGEEYLLSKEFCDKDWTAIKRMQAAGLRVIMASADAWNEQIAKDRKIEFIKTYTTGHYSKYNVIKGRGIDLSKSIYVGDDYYDIELLCHARYRYCPEDAIDEVKNVCIKIPAKGGENCIAAFYDMIKGNIRENFPHER